MFTFLLAFVIGFLVGGLVVVMYYRKNKEHMLALENLIRKQYGNFESKVQDEASKLLNKNK